MEKLELKLLWETYHGLKKCIAVQNKKIDNIDLTIRTNAFLAKDDQFTPNQINRLREAFLIKGVIDPESIDFEKANDLLENLELILIKYGEKK